MEFSDKKQKLLIEYMLADESVFSRCRNILKPSYFDSDLESVVKYILIHSGKYNTVPTVAQIKAETGTSVELIPSVREQDQDWALEQIEKFCQQEAIVEAVNKSIEHIQKGNRDIVEELVREACLVQLQKDLGTDYFLDPKTRLQNIIQRDLIPTGISAIDRKLYGGLNRGEITIFTASSGVGKSLFLQNICLNWVSGVKYENKGFIKNFQPMDVVYITLELSEELTSKRIDTMITGIEAQEVLRRIDEVELKVVIHGKKSGNFMIKYLPGDCTSNANTIRAYLKEYEIQKGKLPDAIAIDYLDELDTNRGNIRADDIFTKDKYVTSELRQLAVDLDIPLITASQLNRCIFIDELVEEQNSGIMRIGDIKEGDKIKSQNGYNNVVQVFPKTKQKVFKIKTKSGKSITVSADHKFPTINGLKSINTGLDVGDILDIDCDGMI